MRVAVVGTGISGLASAWLLNRKFEVHVFEKLGRLGGHAHSVVTQRQGRALHLDKGFIVFNRDNHPTLTRLFDLLKVSSQEADMSFAVRCECCDLEYSGRGPLSLFAQRRNLLRPAMYRMLADILQPLSGRALRSPQRKVFHVSPFIEMEDVGYDWVITPPGDTLTVHIDEFRQGRNSSTPRSTCNVGP
jgi:predicted NAD/FAD-binding protein